MSFAIDMSRSNLRLLERGVQVTTYDFGFIDNSAKKITWLQFKKNTFAWNCDDIQKQ
jgi:hypothetical protein